MVDISNLLFTYNDLHHILLLRVVVIVVPRPQRPRRWLIVAPSNVIVGSRPSFCRRYLHSTLHLLIEVHTSLCSLRPHSHTVSYTGLYFANTVRLWEGPWRSTHHHRIFFGRFFVRKISRPLVRDFHRFVLPSTRPRCPLVLAWSWNLTVYILKIIAIPSASRKSCGRRFKSSSSSEALSYEYRVKFRNYRQRSRSADRPVKLRNFLTSFNLLLISSSPSISHWGRTYSWSSSSGFHQHLYYFQWFTI